MLNNHSDKADNITQAINNLQRRWMIGQVDNIDLKQLPKEWQTAFQALPPERWNLAALAWSSQFDLMALRPELSGELSTRAELPELDLPLLPHPIRPLFRSVLVQCERERATTLPLFLALLQQRGYVAHPVDWLPESKSLELPTVYWPWLQWMHEQSGADAFATMDTVDVDNWDDYYPAARVLLLKAQRSQNPEDTRELIAQCMSREVAEHRLKILQVLEIGLSSEDVPFLSTLLSDRSGKVARLAGHYLRRLGQTQPESKDQKQQADNELPLAQELAQQYELSRSGLIKKKSVLKPRKLKSKKQQAIRTEQIGQVELTELAAVLELSLNCLIEVWAFDANREQDNLNFIQNAVDSLPDNDIQTLSSKLLGSGLDAEGELVYALKLLWARLNASQQLHSLEQLIRRKKGLQRFQDYLALLDQPLPESVLDIATIKSSPAWKALSQDIKADTTEHGYLNHHTNLEALLALGLLVSKPVAGELLELLLGLGVNKSDPALDSIKINVSL